MKYVLIPAALELSGGFRYTLLQAVVYVVDTAPEFARPASRIRAGARVVAALEQADSYAELRDEDWALLDQVFDRAESFGVFAEEVRDPAGKVIASTRVAVPARKFLPFITAINEPRNDPPAPSVA